MFLLKATEDSPERLGILGQVDHPDPPALLDHEGTKGSEVIPAPLDPKEKRVTGCHSRVKKAKRVIKDSEAPRGHRDLHLRQCLDLAPLYMSQDQWEKEDLEGKKETKELAFHFSLGSKVNLAPQDPEENLARMEMMD